MTIRTSFHFPILFCDSELISVVMSPPTTPNNSWGFNRRNKNTNAQENYTTLSFPLGKMIPFFTPKDS